MRRFASDAQDISAFGVEGGRGKLEANQDEFPERHKWGPISSCSAVGRGVAVLMHAVVAPLVGGVCRSLMGTSRAEVVEILPQPSAPNDALMVRPVAAPPLAFFGRRSRVCPCWNANRRVPRFYCHRSHRMMTSWLHDLSTICRWRASTSLCLTCFGQNPAFFPPFWGRNLTLTVCSQGGNKDQASSLPFPLEEF